MDFKNKIILILPVFFVSLFCFAQAEKSNDSLLLQNLIKPYIVFNNDFVRNTFYTWTTPEQIVELRKNKTLLTKSKSDTKGYSLFDMSIRDSSYNNFLIAQLLRQPQFAKKRFAWTSGWATVMGLEGESYGNQLIKIVLSDSAIIGSFHPQNLANPFQFFDMKGKELKADYVIENSDRLTAFFHMNRIDVSRMEEQTKRGRGTYYNYTGKYKKGNSIIEMREFVIINKSMVTWSYGTNEIKNDILKEIGFLEQLQKLPSAVQKGYRCCDCSFWKDAESFDFSPFCDFSLTKCFDNDYYLFNKKQLQAIIDQLKLVFIQQSQPITN